MPGYEAIIDSAKRTLEAARQLKAGRVQGPQDFRQRVKIDANGQTVTFKADPWQEADFRALDPAWMQIAGLGPPARINRGWEERPRGHSKTTDIDLMVSWALSYAQRPIHGIVCASSKEQAGLHRDFIDKLNKLNDDLSLKVHNWEVVNEATGSKLEIMSSDVAASWGYLVDFVICDEICHWPEGRGEEFWKSVFTTAAKRDQCLLVCITNAGFLDSWVWKLRESVRQDPNWYFSRLEGPTASWITQKNLDEQRRHLPPGVYARLWDNVWSTGSGDAIPEAELQEAVRGVFGPCDARWSGCEYYGGIDLSVSRDTSAVVVIAKNQLDGRLILVQCRAWKPPAGGKIDLRVVEDAIRQMDNVFHAHWFLDPYQGEIIYQDLLTEGRVIETVPFGGAALIEMASGLTESFHSRMIQLFRDEQLLNDLRKLKIKETPAGYKLDAPRTAAGHCDRATALSLAVLGARRSPLPICGEFSAGAESESSFHNIPQGVFAQDFMEEFTGNIDSGFDG
jgi:phage terminase large subunit-like protein